LPVRIGIHVQAIGGGTSDSFINDLLPIEWVIFNRF
jgi:hypothetical protein